jgi:hypothetical protein
MNPDQYASFFVEAFAHSSKSQTQPVSSGNPGFTPIDYFGLLRPAQEFGPVMRSRGADGQSSAVPWVNLLSIFALSLARACVATLKDDVEDVYPGDVAQDGLPRFKKSRKVMEGELATG